MKTSLLHPLGQPHSSRHRPKRPAEQRPGRMAALAHRRKVEPGNVESAMSAHRPGDLAVKRTRAAGGPLDRACYTCECGFIFAAPVSTTVACPHCGTGQAW